MTLAVLVASGVAEPYIIASASHLEGGSDFWLVSDPAVGGVQYTVLEVYNFLALGDGTLALESIDTEHGEDVSVAGSH